MDTHRACTFYEQARDYVRQHHARELEYGERISPETFRRLTARQFLADYCWVVYGSGFRVQVVEQIFPELRRAFKDFDLDVLSRSRSVQPALKIFNNERKAQNFLDGAKAIASEGFSAFKRRLRVEGMDALEELPGIGPITKKHLARNIGLADVAKDDVWLRRLVQLFRAEDEDALVSVLAERYGDRKGVVDLVLWRFCAEEAWLQFGAASLDQFVQSLGPEGD